MHTQKDTWVLFLNSHTRSKSSTTAAALAQINAEVQNSFQDREAGEWRRRRRVPQAVIIIRTTTTTATTSVTFNKQKAAGLATCSSPQVIYCISLNSLTLLSTRAFS